MSEIYDKTNIFKAYYGQVSEDARLAGVTDEVTLTYQLFPLIFFPPHQHSWLYQQMLNPSISAPSH